jgi:hypothetical protein
VTRDEVHDRARYRRGCRCGACRAANRLYQRERRAGSGDANASPAVSSAVSGAVTPAVSAVSDAVTAELTMLGPHTRPGLAAGALAMARILDDPCAVPQHPAAAGRLFAVLEELHVHAPRRAGKLAAVRRLTSGDIS